ncbi:MAG: DUF3501 family protein [Bacteroidetes bacterium]|nr:DUF3501 family protein [Bacteroidota bacterium]
MKTIEINELLNIIDYEKVRNTYRSDIISYKTNRRVLLGNQISMVFENRKTMKFQIQEMMRAERMVHDEAIQHEIDVYNSLLPAENELSATLFIEITEEEKIREDLHKFLGLTDGKSLWIEFGSNQVFAEFEAGRSEEDRISSVHYIRFPFTPAQIEEFQNVQVPAYMKISQKTYQHSLLLGNEIRTSLISDLLEKNK